jgi:hypothetical protein
MSITLRQEKGAPLTWEELDANFEELADTRISKALFAGGSKVLVQVDEEDEPIALEIGENEALANVGGVLQAVSFNTIAPKKRTVITHAGPNRTFLADDTSLHIVMSNATEITCVLPEDMEVGWHVTCEQAGAGRLAFQAAGDGVLHGRSSYTKSASQYSVVTVLCTANPDGESAEYLLYGDLAAS